MVLYMYYVQKNFNSNILMWIYVRKDNLNEQSTKWSLENKN